MAVRVLGLLLSIRQSAQLDRASGTITPLPPEGTVHPARTTPCTEVLRPHGSSTAIADSRISDQHRQPEPQRGPSFGGSTLGLTNVHSGIRRNGSRITIRCRCNPTVPLPLAMVTMRGGQLSSGSPVSGRRIPDQRRRYARQ